MRNEHPELALSLHNLSQVLLKEGKLADAEATLRTALALQRTFCPHREANWRGRSISRMTP